MGLFANCYSVYNILLWEKLPCCRYRVAIISWMFFCNIAVLCCMRYFNLNIDFQRRFYGPNERWMSVWMGFLRVGTWQNLTRAMGKKIDGNLVGEGRLLGGKKF